MLLLQILKYGYTRRLKFIIIFFYKVVPDQFLKKFFYKVVPGRFLIFFFFNIKLSQTNPFHTTYQEGNDTQRMKVKDEIWKVNSQIHKYLQTILQVTNYFTRSFIEYHQLSIYWGVETKFTVFKKDFELQSDEGLIIQPMQEF